MCIKNMGQGAMGLVLMALLAGCGKSESASSSAGNSQNQQVQNDPVLSLHWAGMKRLSVEPSAAGFMRIWRLPETEKLKARTLDKLALAPWQAPGTNQTRIITNYAALVQQNHAASLLRPLLEDVVQDECYVEIRGAEPSPAQVAVAIHLDAKRAAAWETELAGVFGSNSNSHSKAASGGTNVGWQIQYTNRLAARPVIKQAQLARFGDWTVIGFGPAQNAAFTDLSTRAQHNQFSSPAAATKDWLQTTFDLRRLCKALDWDLDLPEEWPRAALNFSGNGSNVLTGGKLTFSKPLQAPVEAWNVPTNLIHEPVQSLTAVQGIGPWLASTRWWRDAHPAETPNQVFWWAQSGSPFLDYAAAPLQSASTMSKLGAAIMNSMNPTLSSNRMGSWERVPGSDAVVWTRAPIIKPFAGTIETGSKRFLFAGVSPQAITNTPPPMATINDLKSSQNVVFFDREITGPRVEAWMFMSQLLRIILRREQLPEGALTVAWLKAAGPSFGPASTTLTRTSSTELAVSRSSTIGLNSIELHLLADWLESPAFPFKPFTIVEKLPPPPVSRKASGPGQK
jgi:hypothetical protein